MYDHAQYLLIINTGEVAEDFKKKIVDTLNQNKKLFASSESSRDAGMRAYPCVRAPLWLVGAYMPITEHWKVKKLVDPWKGGFNWSANLYTQTKRSSKSNNKASNYWARESKKQKVASM